jgi:diadenosine tetraphosphate (Ap4A) HIT family hydrolase
MAEDCPFCEIDSSRIWLDNAIGIVIRDAYPVSEGHALVVPRRHAASIYDLPSHNQDSLWELVSLARQASIEKYSPDGFNIGINDGMVAGHVLRQNTGNQAAIIRRVIEARNEHGDSLVDAQRDQRSWTSLVQRIY